MYIDNRKSINKAVFIWLKINFLSEIYLKQKNNKRFDLINFANLNKILIVTERALPTLRGML